MSIFDDCPRGGIECISVPKLIPKFEKNIKKWLKTLDDTFDWKEMKVDTVNCIWKLYATNADPKTDADQIRNVYLYILNAIKNDTKTSVKFKCYLHTQITKQYTAKKIYFSYIEINNSKYEQTIRIFWTFDHKESNSYNFIDGETVYGNVYTDYTYFKYLVCRKRK